MIALVLAFALALFWNVAVGWGFAILWNLALPAVIGLPEVSWPQGIGIFLILRLVLSPPKFELTLGANN